MVLTPNGLIYSSFTAVVGQTPQRNIWDEYAKLYEFYMVEHIEIEYYPTILRQETTTTGSQDTAIYPTVSGHIPEISTNVINFFNPATTLTDLEAQASNLMARKSGNLKCG